MSIIFGPVPSRRFGKSLGIDLSPGRKQCNFDCVYCELAPAKPMESYEEVLPVSAVIDAVREGLRTHPDIDVLTVTANGEPTLYPHLEELMEELADIKGPVKTLILSNASTIHRPEIRRALRHFDTVKLSLDCATPRCFKRIDRPAPDIDLEAIKEGMLAFRKEYRGALIVEILIVAGINDKASEIEALDTYLLRLRPDRIDLGTIDRPPAYDVRPVDYEKLRALSLHFDPELPVHITSRKNPGALTPSAYTDDEILDTLRKRPLTPDDIRLLFDEESRKRLERLIHAGKVRQIENHGVNFYICA